MRTNRFTFFGLVIVALGWVALIADMTVSEAMLRAGNLVAVISLRSDIVTIAQTAIISGFGLALIGALRGGIGTLNGSFESASERSPGAKSNGILPFDDAPPEIQMPIPMTMNAAPVPNSYLQDRSGAASQIRPVPAAYQAMSERPVSSGQIKDRNYVILSDGSVEVETLLGTRVFASLDEARDFIR